MRQLIAACRAGSYGVVFALGMATAVLAVEPSEVLDDPALEARARDISAGLRCPVCQSESIDESNAVIARDLRLLVRERLVAGDSNVEVVDYVVDRFGEFVLLRPDARGANLFLWFAAPAMLGIALLVGWTTIKRRPDLADETLSDDEKARLDEIMRS